jgi:hypothetical protein
MKNSTIIIWEDKTITYKVGNSTFTEKIVQEFEDYYHVVGIGAGEQLWKSGFSIGNRVYKKEQLID